MKYSLKLNQVREILGMEVKLESAKLQDGVTVVEYEKLEPGMPVFVVSSTRCISAVGDCLRSIATRCAAGQPSRSASCRSRHARRPPYFDARRTCAGNGDASGRTCRTRRLVD